MTPTFNFVEVHDRVKPFEDAELQKKILLTIMAGHVLLCSNREKNTFYDSLASANPELTLGLTKEDIESEIAKLKEA